MDQEIKVAIIVATPPTLAAGAALITSVYNTLKIRDLHIIVNSRLSKLLAVTKENALAKGRRQGLRAKFVPASKRVATTRRAKRRRSTKR